MNLLDALKSGKKFKRKDEPPARWRDFPENFFWTFSKQDLLGDYEVEEKKVEVTREQVIAALWNNILQVIDPILPRNCAQQGQNRESWLQQIVENFTKELGL